MLSVTKAYLCDTFMAWAGLENLDGTPTKICIPSSEENKFSLDSTIGKFVDMFILAEFDVEKKQREEAEKERILGKKANCFSN